MFVEASKFRPFEVPVADTFPFTYDHKLDDRLNAKRSLVQATAPVVLMADPPNAYIELLTTLHET